MSSLGRFAALAVALAVLVAAGCGGTEIDPRKVEDQIEANVESTLGKKVSAVECPSGVAVEPKTKFTCTVRFKSGNVETATLLIRDEDANLSLLSLQSSK